MVLTLYKLNSSPPVRSVFMTIQALNIPDVEYVDVNLLEGANLTEEYLKVNPQHTIPMLKDDDFYVWDSHAITAYLITKYAQDDSLYPKDPRKRAVVDQRLHFDSGVLFPACLGAVGSILFGSDKKFKPENIENIKKAYDIAEKLLTSDWMAGDDVTLADICCVSTVTSMDFVLPIDKSEYPNLSAWLKRCSQLEFYKKGNAPGLAVFKEFVKMKMAS